MTTSGSNPEALERLFSVALRRISSQQPAMSPEGVRILLTGAQDEGLDPAILYQESGIPYPWELVRPDPSRAVKGTGTASSPTTRKRLTSSSMGGAPRPAPSSPPPTTVSPLSEPPMVLTWRSPHA